MQKIEMTNTKNNSFHPNISFDSQLCEHILYKIIKRYGIQTHNKIFKKNKVIL
jgi:hypothetical protein